MSKNKNIMFISIFTIVGFVILYFGLNGLYDQYLTTKNYLTVEGKFIGTEPYSDGETSRLIYSYNVDGGHYIIKTNYGTSVIPSIGSIKTIKYNQLDPNQAVLKGFNAYSILILIGFMWITIPLIILILTFYKSNIKKHIY